MQDMEKEKLIAILKDCIRRVRNSDPMDVPFILIEIPYDEEEKSVYTMIYSDNVDTDEVCEAYIKQALFTLTISRSEDEKWPDNVVPFIPKI